MRKCCDYHKSNTIIAEVFNTVITSFCLMLTLICWISHRQLFYRICKCIILFNYFNWWHFQIARSHFGGNILLPLYALIDLSSKKKLPFAICLFDLKGQFKTRFASRNMHRHSIHSYINIHWEYGHIIFIQPHVFFIYKWYYTNLSCFLLGDFFKLWHVCPPILSM